MKIGAHPTLGFTLVELSIVLVILGLLVGGVLTGQSLIHAAELRSISTQEQGYVTAVQTFRDKYFALPGDMTNAIAFWGQNTACGGATATGTCNGNGDGYVSDAGTANGTNEVLQFWKQLGLAGLVEGNFTGLAGPGASNHSIIGTNVPGSKMSGVGWFSEAVPNYPGDSIRYKADYGNTFHAGVIATNSYPIQPYLKPEDAYNIDTKMDDGKPGTGKVIAIYWATCATSSANNDYTGAYALSSPTVLCSLYFSQAY